MYTEDQAQQADTAMYAKQAAMMRGSQIGSAALRPAEPRVTEAATCSVENLIATLEQALKSLSATSDRMFSDAQPPELARGDARESRPGSCGLLLDRIDYAARLAVLVVQATARLEQRL